MNKILVTGATGFIGRNALPALLERGFEVWTVVLEHESPTFLDARVRLFTGDLLDESCVRQLFREQRFSHLLHFAWDVTPGRYANSLGNIKWVAASCSMLSHFHENGGRRAVLAGTCFEYDWSHGFCSERVTPLVPSSLYGRCKNSLNQIFEGFCAQAGLSGAWGRIFFVFGPYEHPSRLVSSVVQSLLAKTPVPCTHGRQIRDFLYVEDVARAFVDLLCSEVEGSVNIASGEPLSVKDLTLTIGEMLNASELLEFGKIPLSPSEPPLLVADVRRLRDEVGFRPRYSLEEALAKTIRFWEMRMRT